MKQFFRDIRNSFFLSAAVSIFLGIVLLVYPVKTTLMICYVTGALLLICGIIDLIRYFTAKPQPFMRQYDLFVGIVLIIVGGFVIAMRQAIVAVIPIILGIIILLNGLFSLQKSWNLKRQGFDRWWIELLLSLLTSLLGLVICLNPFDAIATTNIFIGICLIYNGITDVYTTYCMAKVQHTVDHVLSDDHIIDVEEDELH